MKISRKQQSMITKIIDDLYFKVKARLFGKKFRGPRLYVELAESQNPLSTLEGMFRYTYMMQRANEKKIDKGTISTAQRITQNYLDAHKLKMRNEILQTLSQAESAEEASEMVQEKMDKAKGYLDTLITTETRNLQSFAEAEGIETAAAALGIDDPTVVKLGITDNRLCKNCKKLWHSETNVRKPKPYKLSELKGGYSTHKNPIPTVNSTHPNCRHVSTMVSPGFGFDQSGKIKFISFDYDYYSDMRKD